MRLHHFLFPIIFLLLFSSCSTPYKSTGFTGGYDETWLSEREVKVVFNGNGYTSSKKAADYTAYRACELTLQNGYSHFVVLNSKSGGTTSTSQITPDRTEISPNGYGGLTARTDPGETMTVFKPSNRMTVFFLTKEEAEISRSEGFRPISAKFFIQRNAPEKIRDRILNQE